MRQEIDVPMCNIFCLASKNSAPFYIYQLEGNVETTWPVTLTHF